MKEHVEVLREMLCAWHFEEEEAALRAALDLMNAAEPMDEAAEREHCVCVASLIWNGPCSAEAAVETLMRERAAAEARGCARGRLEPVDLPTPRERALEAEIERRRDVQVHDAMLAGQTLLALQAAQAEIERLQNIERNSLVAIELATKLSNLRTSAEDTLGDWTNVKQRDALRTAIEATK